MSKNEHAFPLSTIDGFTQHGMPLRDYFAGKAMILISEQTAPMLADDDRIQNTAIVAYKYADAMLAARSGEQS